MLRSLLGATILAAGTAVAQDLPGDAQAGLIFARGHCADCHYVERDWSDLFVFEAPSFIDVARGSNHNEMSLRVFLKTPHLTMPNFILSEDETANVISYILSLREQ